MQTLIENDERAMYNRPMLDIINDIKRMVDMRDVCARYGIQVDRAGFARCLWHDERTPSMKVYHDGCYCFGCHVQKDVIDVVQQVYGISFREACLRISDDFGLGINFGEKLTDEEWMAFKNAIQKRLDDEKKLDLEHRRLQDAYSSALGRWLDLDKIKDERAPSDPFDPLDDAYVVACAELPAAEYALDVAKEDLRQFEARRYKKEA